VKKQSRAYGKETSVSFQNNARRDKKTIEKKKTTVKKGVAKGIMKTLIWLKNRRAKREEYRLGLSRGGGLYPHSASVCQIEENQAGGTVGFQ